ncbi:MAG TPA: dephospho-CoA kinase [Gaiellaceae bacterium]|nr:dephospho-CoA kinase [Gaiellaceae bacterium]
MTGRTAKPVSVAITGGIGAGKSEALKAFARHGAAVVSSDEIVHHLIRNDPDVKAAMVERLGEEILDQNGDIERSFVGAKVFNDREALAWLEGLLHPLVSAEYLRWREQLAELPEPPPAAVTEVPLLYEVGGETRFDKVVVITAPEKLREARAKVPVAGRTERLLPDREKVERADYSYVNTGSLEELDAFIATVMEELRALRAPQPR